MGFFVAVCLQVDQSNWRNAFIVSLSLTLSVLIYHFKILQYIYCNKVTSLLDGRVEEEVEEEGRKTGMQVLALSKPYFYPKNN